MDKSMTVKQKADEEVIDGKPVHELAKLFPPMPKVELEALVEDVRENGLVDHVVLYEGMILDGVHRLKACLLANKKPEFKEWDGECGSPLQFVCTKNLSRRSLTAGQKAVIAVTLEKEFAKAAKLRMSSRNRSKCGGETFPPHVGAGKARDAAAKAAGVNPHYVTDAKALSTDRPDLFDKVWLGHLTLASAMQQVKGDQNKNGSPTHKVSIIFQGTRFISENQPETVARKLAAGFVEKDIAVRIKNLRADKKPKMYADAKTWNPFKGCNFGCTYCEPSFKKQAKRRKPNESGSNGCAKCYKFLPHEHDCLNSIPNTSEGKAVKTIFVCGDADISFASPSYVKKIIEAIKRKNERNKRQNKPKQTFYMQSKRPDCFKPFLNDLPNNVILLTTLETNRDEGYGDISKAPLPSKRYRQFRDLDYRRKIVTVEPLMDFDAEEFASWLISLKPECVWLGYNSHEAKILLPEPPHRKVMQLAEVLLNNGVKILGKDLRGLDMPEGVERTQD